MLKQLLIALLFCAPAFAQGLNGINGSCSLPGQSVLTQGLASKGTQPIGDTTISYGSGVLASYPSCLVTVYKTGTQDLVTIYSDNLTSPTVLSNPFMANQDGSFLFYVTSDYCYDLTEGTGTGPTMPTQASLADVCVGRGNVFLNPTGSQFINQPFANGVKTSFNPNVDNDVVKLNLGDPTLNWSQSPTTPPTISAGAATVGITCPKGITSAVIGKDFTVYVAGTGTPETPVITATTCAGDGVQGTVTFTATQAHAGGYTIGSASNGLREASEYSIFLNTGSVNPASKGGYVEVSPGSILQLYGTTNIEAYGQTINFEGSTVQINADFATYTCGLKIGSNAGSGGGAFGGNKLLGLTGLRAGVPAAASFCLNSQNTFIDDLGMLVPAAGNYFEHVLQVINDQGALINRMQIEAIGTANFVCTATDCPSIVFGSGLAGNSGIIQILDLNLSLNNKANCYDWKNANTLMIGHLICQNYAQFIGRSNSAFVNNMNVIIGSTYIEGNCAANPLGLGCMAFNFQSGISKIGLSNIDAALPRFANTGATVYFYWVCPKNASAQAGNCLLAGYSQLTTTGTYNVLWYDISPGGSFDVIRWATNSLVAPTSGNCTGGSVAACGSIATALAEGTVCDATTHVCTFTDDISASTTAYTVPTPIFYPKVDFWPGAFVLGPSAATTTVTNGAKLLLDAYTAGGDILSGGIVNIFGANANSIIVQTCTNSANWTSTSIVCLNFPANGVGATWLRPEPTAGTGALQGRMTFAQQPGLPLFSTDLITIKSADPQLTFATALMRPPWQAGDTALGYISSGTSGIYLRDNVSVKNFIGKLPDATPQEQLTATLKTFGVPVGFTETTAPSAAAGFDICYGSSSLHTFLCSFNGGTFLPIVRTIASGSLSLSTSSIAAGACSAAVTATATGLTAGGVVNWSLNGNPSAATGYAGSSSGAVLQIYAYPTTNTVNFKTCNNSSGAIVPDVMGVNWNVQQ